MNLLRRTLEWLNQKSVPLMLTVGLATVILGIVCLPTLSKWLGYDSELLEYRDKASLRLSLIEIIVEAVGFSIAIFTAWQAWSQATRRPKLRLSFEEHRNKSVLNLHRWDSDRAILWLRNEGNAPATRIIVRLKPSTYNYTDIRLLHLFPSTLRLPQFEELPANVATYGDAGYIYPHDVLVDLLNEKAPTHKPWRTILTSEHAAFPHISSAQTLCEFNGAEDFIVYPRSAEPISSSFPTACRPQVTPKGLVNKDILLNFDYEIFAERLSSPVRATISVKGAIVVPEEQETA